MTLREKLEAAGVRAYTSEPIWKRIKVLDTVQVGDNVVVARSTEYDTLQLVIEDNGARMYVPLKSGSRADQTEFQLVQFEAVRDWEEYKIKEGDLRVFAL